MTSLILGYVRVSSIEQESGYGPEVQRKAIADYCQRQGLSDPTFVEESASAESLAGRREMLVLLAEARRARERGEDVHLIFRSSDRLARDLMDQESVVTDSLARGYRLHSTQAHEADLFNPAYAGDPMRVAIRQFFGIFNQLDKAIIQQRLDSGLLAKASAGGSTGGRYPFGYKGVNGEITIDELEAEPVRAAFAAEKAGLDLGSIAELLAVQFPILCGHFTKTSVKRILDRRGLYVGGRYRPRLARTTTEHPELVIVTGEPPPAMTEEPLEIPDPCPIYTVAIMSGRSVQWCTETAAARGIPVHWKGKRPQVTAKGAGEILALARQ